MNQIEFRDRGLSSIMKSTKVLPRFYLAQNLVKFLLINRWKHKLKTKHKNELSQNQWMRETIEKQFKYKILNCTSPPYTNCCFCCIYCNSFAIRNTTNEFKLRRTLWLQCWNIFQCWLMRGFSLENVGQTTAELLAGTKKYCNMLIHAG